MHRIKWRRWLNSTECTSDPFWQSAHIHWSIWISNTNPVENWMSNGRKEVFEKTLGVAKVSTMLNEIRCLLMQTMGETSKNFQCLWVLFLTRLRWSNWKTQRIEEIVYNVYHSLPALRTLFMTIYRLMCELYFTHDMISRFRRFFPLLTYASSKIVFRLAKSHCHSNGHCSYTQAFAQTRTAQTPTFTFESVCFTDQKTKKKTVQHELPSLRGSFKANVIKRLSHPISLLISSLSVLCAAARFFYWPNIFRCWFHFGVLFASSPRNFSAIDVITHKKKKCHKIGNHSST